MTKKVRRNDPCPCGSGKKYKKCCSGKDFDFVEDENGNFFREIPVSNEMMEMVREQRDEFTETFGRPPGPTDKVFFNLPHGEQLEHEIVQTMREAGISPEKVYAFIKTGRLLSEENKRFLTDSEVEAWYAACDEYQERFGRVLAVKPPFERSELAERTVSQLSSDGRVVRYIEDYANYLRLSAEARAHYGHLLEAALSGFPPIAAFRMSEQDVLAISKDRVVTSETLLSLFEIAIGCHQEIDAVSSFEFCLFVDDFAKAVLPRLGLAQDQRVKERHDAVCLACYAHLFTAMSQHFGLSDPPELD